MESRKSANVGSHFVTDAKDSSSSKNTGIDVGFFLPPSQLEAVPYVFAFASVEAAKMIAITRKLSL